MKRQGNMKQCGKCGQVKNVKFYSVNSCQPDGLSNQCKPCHNKYIREYKKNNPEFYHKSRMRWLTRMAARTGNPPYARLAVVHAKHIKFLVAPEKCQECGVPTDKLQCHHEDYRKALDVLWVCQSCHSKMDGNRRSAEGRPLLAYHTRHAYLTPEDRDEIRKLRKQGLSQVQVGLKLGLSNCTISRLEKADRNMQSGTRWGESAVNTLI